MKKFYLGAATIVALSAAGAYAQAAAPTTPATPPAATAPAAPVERTEPDQLTAPAPAPLTLLAADVTKLKDWITGQKTASVATPAGLTIAVGSSLPMTVMLYAIPASVGVTAVGMNQYAVINDKIVLVNPTNRKIVYVFS